jgi:energy-coupling factor transporter ATP-binding protein EcfA2
LPRISPDGSIIVAPQLKLTPKTDGRRRLSDWLGAFLDYTSQLNCSDVYLKWTGLSTLAAAAQRKVYMDNPAFFAFTNMYIVLVGPPGSGKSTAIRAGRKLIKKIPTINISPEAPSVVGIMQEFDDIKSVQKDHQSHNAFIGEFSSLFENATETMTGFLTTIYDGEDDYTKRTRVGGKEHIPFPWLNLIAGTTHTWLGDNLKKSAVEGGLVARTLFINSDEIVLKTSYPTYSAELRQLQEYLIHDLAHITALNGEFDFEGGMSGDAFRWFDNWWFDRSRFPKVTDNRTAGYYVRKPVHLLKTAMAVSLSKGDSLRMSLDNLQVALAFLDQIEPGMSKAFSAVGGNMYATEIERVERILRQAGVAGLSYADLVAATYHNMEQRQLDATLTTLRSMGRIAGQISTGFKISD